MAAGFALNYDAAGNMLGTQPGKVVRSDIYVNRDQLKNLDYPGRVYIFAHEMGHSFELDDHSKENINSIMSYQSMGRLLLGPSFEDVHGVAHIYGRDDLLVRPQDLDGIEGVQSMWYYDRYGKHQSHLTNWSRWKGFFSYFFLGPSTLNDLTSLEPWHTYYVQAKTPGVPVFLGFGRMKSKQAFPGLPWRFE
jgi:hypothetical protein